MGDFNICENISELMQQQLRIRHLLNYLRYNQDNCNDVDCITNDIQLPRADESFDMLSLLLLMALMFGALFTLIRPNLVRNRKQDFNKNQDDDNDDNSRPVPQPTH